VLTESDTGGMLISSQLASHGFVMVSISIPDHNDFFNWDVNMISWPMDFLVTLDQLSLNPLPELQQVYDVVRVGVTGYSYGGDISLALSGARFDPQDYLDWCQDAPLIEVDYGAEWYLENACGPSKKWGEMEAFAGADYTTSTDGLWQPLTDPRIVAVMPMAPSGAWLFGERGLAAADKPVLLIANTKDEFSPYSVETAFIYENLGGPEVSLITFVDRTHMMVFDANEVLRIKHFMVAFFGYYLQGKEEYRQYFSEEFVSQFNDLAWGIVK
jgi:predicted dienelactone hydrolase